jgi:hypothetical protein
MEGTLEMRSALRKRPSCAEKLRNPLRLSSAAIAAKTLTKKQAEALATEESALGKIKSQLAAFRVK